jgi:hypothetical protein
MEYWGPITDDGLILFSDSCHPYKSKSNSAKTSIPSFQYSIIPQHMHIAQSIFSERPGEPGRHFLNNERGCRTTDNSCTRQRVRFHLQI